MLKIGSFSSLRARQNKLECLSVESFFRQIIHLLVRLGAYPKCGACPLALFANIRLVLKGLPGTSTHADLVYLSATKKKSFVTLTTGVNI
jgi:hypothetical protein